MTILIVIGAIVFYFGSGVAGAHFYIDNDGDVPGATLIIFFWPVAVVAVIMKRLLDMIVARSKK